MRYTQLRIRPCVCFCKIYMGDVIMSVKRAVVERFVELCKERNIRPNELASLSGVTASTVYSMLDSRRKDVSIITIKKLCDGLDISLQEFFTAKIFDELDQEIL